MTFKFIKNKNDRSLCDLFQGLLWDLVIFYVWVKAVLRVLTKDFDPSFIVASASLLLLVLTMLHGGPI